MDTTSDVIVVGGGVIGLSVADRLAREGLGVTLLERGLCGREASWASAGILKPSNPNRRGPMQQIQRAGLHTFPAYCADLRERTGIDPEYARCGSLELLFNDHRYRMALSEQRASARQTVADGPGDDLEWQVLEPVDAAELEPGISRDCLGVLLCRSAAQVRNPRLLKALQAACRTGGVRIEEHSPVTRLVIDADRIRGVETETRRFAARWAVLAAGAWSSQIDPRVGSAIPTYPVRGQVVLLDASDLPGARFSHIVDRKGCYLVRRREGLVLIGATVEHESGFDRRNTPGGVTQLMEDALTLLPGLAGAGVAGMWSGLRPGTPDQRPYLGPLPGVEGLVVATGHYRTGLALAPVTAEIVRDLLVCGRSERDLSRCRPGRTT